jgi:plasmid stabilization system protein ParE
MVAFIISTAAKRQLEATFQYIYKDSVQNAEQFKKAIIRAVKELSIHPEK